MLGMEPITTTKLLGLPVNQATTWVLTKAKNKLTDKKINVIFHEAFGNNDYHIILALCADETFLGLLFQVAEGKIIDTVKLSERGLTLAETGKLKITATEIDSQLRSFALDLLERYRGQKGGATVGDQSTAFTHFFEQMDRRLNSNSKYTSESPLQYNLQPGFYLDHGSNANLCHTGKWTREIFKTLKSQSRTAIAQGSLVGEGGIGKTAIAIEYAHEYQHNYEGGVYWLEVDQGIELPLRNMLGRLGVAISPDDTDESLLTLFVDSLNRIQEQKLVILDNLEDTNLPNRFALSKGHILVTTRMPKIAMPTIDILLPHDDEALDILLGYSKYKDSALTDEQEKLAQDLCQRCGNLPLALEILGTMLTTFGLEYVSAMSVDLLDEVENVTSKKAKTTIRQVLALAEKEYKHPEAMTALVHAAYLHPDHIQPEIISSALSVTQQEAVKMLAALAEWSVLKSHKDGKYTCHRLLNEAARDLDVDDSAGERMAVIVDCMVKDETEKGLYLLANGSIPHILHLSGMADESTEEENLPRNSFMYKWANFLKDCGHYQLSEKLQRVCSERIKLSRGDGHYDYVIGLNGLAQSLSDQHKFEEAESLYRLILSLIVKHHGTEHLHYAYALNNWGLLICSHGYVLTDENDRQRRFREAEMLFEKGLSALAMVQGADHPDHAVFLASMALAKGRQGKYEEAVSLYIQAIAIDEKTIGTDHPRYAKRLNGLADVLGEQGEYEEAEKLYRQVLIIQEKTIGTDHPVYLTCLNDMAYIFYRRGKHKEAEKLYLQVLSTADDKMHSRYPNYVLTCKNLADLYRNQGKYGDAKALYRKALTISRGSNGEDHPFTLQIETAIAELDKQ